MKRRKTRTVKIGNVNIGSGYPIAIQSMTISETSDVTATVAEIHELEEAGCEIIRCSVKSMEDASALSDIKKEISIPVVADIHFDHRLALEAIKYGADKIRINPGNMRKEEHVDAVIDACRDKNVPIRVGVNSGSLAEGITDSDDITDWMVESLLGHLRIFEKRNFHNIVVSIKGSEVGPTVNAYRKVAKLCDYPFHLGITAAGLPDESIVKSSVGIGAILLDGIGDTLRVSLTGESLPEIETAKRILSSAGARYFKPDIIACPTCGRCQVDLVPIVKELEKELENVKGEGSNILVKKDDKQLVIAVMGCEVNGPGEAKGADLGIAFGKKQGAIFSQGKIVKTVDVDKAIKELMKIIKKEM